MQDKNNQASSQTSIRIPHPAGLVRLAMRSPILLYRLRLGWLLGKRFLLLEHRGRKSGVIRRTVIEVVDHDPQVGSFVVAAAWGNKSDWFKNISAYSKVTIEVGLRKFSAIARMLPNDEATHHLTVYAKKHPLAFKQLGSILIGSTSSESEKIVKSLVDSVPLVQFIPSK
ncbi:MAG: nitroreductase family deazaflavin-dependent oxidoreductase [Chloroflexota bacterium]